MLTARFVPLPAALYDVPQQARFTPAVDIVEDAQRVLVTLEVPGVTQENLDIHVENNTLTVKGERKLPVPAKEETALRIERRSGSFSRSFTLPQTADAEAVSATYEAGVLSISIPRKAEAKPRQIKIKSASTPKAEVETPAAA